MKAIILAAGRGSRMKNLTDDRPKCLVEFEGIPLIQWQLNALRGAGITDIGIITGYKSELLSDFGLHEFHNARWSETNMVTSLACAEEWLSSEPCIVSYSDIFYDQTAPDSLQKTSATLAITYDPDWLTLWKQRFDDPLSDAETFRIDENSRLLEIGGKAASVDEIQGQYMGLLRFTPQSWSVMQNIRSSLSDIERDKLQMTHCLKKIIEKDLCPITAIPYRGRWGEFDSADDIRGMEARA